ncbi:DUF2892 domain-containing protein [Calditrichota bacterium]
MKKNMGSIDKWIRLVIGIVVIALGVVFKSFWGLLGIIPLATALVRVCPMYLPFGLSSCKPETKEPDTST